jgi:hypothetical protein
MTREDRAALREAASKAYDSDAGTMCYTWPIQNGTMHCIATTREGTAAVLALLDECERMREALAYYADTFCELDEGHECCGKGTDDQCSGCKARAALGDNA